MTTYTIGPGQGLDAAANKLKPGDVLRLLPGTYNEDVSVALMGTDANPITIEAADMDNRPIIDGGCPQNLEEARRRGVDINFGLPEFGTEYHKRNMNKGSKTYGAKAWSRGLFMCKPDSGNYIIKGLILRNSTGIIWNHIAGSNRGRNVTFEDCVMEWARLQVVSFKRIDNLKFLRCEFSHGASFYQTAGRPQKGPQGDLQTHNATFSMGGIDGFLMEDCVIHDAHGEGFIASANNDPSLNGVIRNFTGYDCYKDPLYMHSPVDWVLENILLYRSEENIAVKSGGVDDPTMKTNGLHLAPSEGDKTWDNPIKNVVSRNVVCHHTYYGIFLAGSTNTVPSSDITVEDCTVINADGFALDLRGNKPKNIIIKNNTFYNDDPNKELGSAEVGRYDSTTKIFNNKWSKKPALSFLNTIAIKHLRNGNDTTNTGSRGHGVHYVYPVIRAVIAYAGANGHMSNIAIQFNR